MAAIRRPGWMFGTVAGLGLVLGAALLAQEPQAQAGLFWKRNQNQNGHQCHNGCCHNGCVPPPCDTGFGGQWYWMRSPDQEQRIVMGIYNRYCIRCHGIDGRGVWDIPDVPDFSDPRWQTSRPDPQIVTILMEGRGAVMPAFRGTMNLEEAWAMARYLRTFVPGTEIPRPDVGRSAPAPAAAPAPAPPAAAAPTTISTPIAPAPNPAPAAIRPVSLR